MRPVEDVHRSMTYHAPSTEVLNDIHQLRRHFMSLALTIDKHVPDGREKAVAYTHLEDALMWATKGCVVGAPEDENS